MKSNVFFNSLISKEKVKVLLLPSALTACYDT